MQPSHLETVELRGKRYTVRHWGQPGAPLLFMLHGWMDCSATFQFVVDQLRHPWHIIAPDWRGHGGSHRTGESYPFLQLVTDLDAFLEHYSPDAPVRIVAHSLGSNTASLYAGARPERVQNIVNLEGLAPVPGLHKSTPVETLSRWLTLMRKGMTNRHYRSHAEMAARLQQVNARLTAERADFLARAFSAERPEGGFEFDVDPYRQVFTPMAGHIQFVESAWPQITAPMLLITGANSEIWELFAQAPGQFAQRLALLKQVEHVHLQNAGHNLHHDQPEQVARLLEGFLKS